MALKMQNNCFNHIIKHLKFILKIKVFNLFIFILLLSSCTNKNKGVKTKYIITKIDSIIINKPTLRFQEIRKKNILFLNQINSEIVIYNLGSKSISSFNKLGGSDKEYNAIYPGSLNFINDSIIGIGQRDKIKTYSLKGDYRGDIKMGNINSHAQLQKFHLFKDSILIAQKPFQGNFYEKSFYNKKRKIFLLKNLKTKKIKSVVDFPLKNEDFNNDEYHYLHPISFPFTIEDNTYIFANVNGKNIHYFNIDSLKITKIIPLSMPFYKPLKLKYGINIEPNKQILDLYINSDIWSIFKNHNKTYILYNKPYSVEFLKKYKKEHPGFPFNETPRIQYYLHIIDNFNKKTNIKVPNKIGYPIYVDNNDYLYIEKFPSEDEDFKGLTIIYKCKVIKNDKI